MASVRSASLSARSAPASVNPAAAPVSWYVIATVSSVAEAATWIGLPPVVLTVASELTERVSHASVPATLSVPNSPTATSPVTPSAAPVSTVSEALWPSPIYIEAAAPAGVPE